MTNHHRGEIEAILDGEPHRLCLTLGALAELESAFGDDDMLALAERFGRGRIAARDAARIIGAGLRGAGEKITDDTVKSMHAGMDFGMCGLAARLFGGRRAVELWHLGAAGATSGRPAASPVCH